MLSNIEQQRFRKEINEILKQHSSEEVSLKVGVKNGTVLNWAAARRKPRKPTVQLIEKFWQVHILDR